MGRLTLSDVWKQKQIPIVLRRTGRGEMLWVCDCPLPMTTGNGYGTGDETG